VTLVITSLVWADVVNQLEAVQASLAKDIAAMLGILLSRILNVVLSQSSLLAAGVKADFEIAADPSSSNPSTPTPLALAQQLKSTLSTGSGNFDSTAQTTNKPITASVTTVVEKPSPTPTPQAAPAPAPKPKVEDDESDADEEPPFELFGFTLPAALGKEYVGVPLLFLIFACCGICACVGIAKYACCKERTGSTSSGGAQKRGRGPSMATDLALENNSGRGRPLQAQYKTGIESVSI
jgi:hypothetical protein